MHRVSLAASPMHVSTIFREPRARSAGGEIAPEEVVWQEAARPICSAHAPPHRRTHTRFRSGRLCRTGRRCRSAIATRSASRCSIVCCGAHPWRTRAADGRVRSAGASAASDAEIGAARHAQDDGVRALPPGRRRSRRALRRLVRARASHPAARRAVLRRPLRRDALVDPDAGRLAALGRRKLTFGPAVDRSEAPREDDAGGLVARLLPLDIQSGARQSRRDARRDAEEILAQSARGRADPRHAGAGRAPHRAHDRSGAARPPRHAPSLDTATSPPPVRRNACRVEGRKPRRASAARCGSRRRRRYSAKVPRTRRWCSSASSPAIRRIWRAGRSSARPDRCSIARSPKPASTARASTSPTR